MVVAGPITLAGAEYVRDKGALRVVAIEQERSITTDFTSGLLSGRLVGVCTFVYLYAFMS